MASEPFQLERHPIVLLRPRIAPPYGWVGHIPFAYLAVDLLRPACLVELGTDSGNSYLAFCQAVKELGLDTRCFAVDTWQGDDHARHYGDEIYRRLRAKHDPLYGQFSSLLRARFEDAVSDFADGSIDLLHIDGFHSYEAVSRDFETWRPKLSARAVVLLHDTRVSDRGFGVARFLGELVACHAHFEFHHANGLAAVAIGTQVPEPFLQFLEHATEHPERIRAYFQGLSERLVAAEDGLPWVSAEHAEPVCRLYFRNAGEHYAESRTVPQSVPVDRGEAGLGFELPPGCRPAYVRIDPADFPGVYGFSQLRLGVAGRGEAHRAVNDLDARIGHVNGNLIGPGSGECLVLAAFDDDPYLEFDIADLVATMPAEGPLTLDIRVDYQAVVQDVGARRLVTRQGEAISRIRELAAEQADLRSLVRETHALSLGLRQQLEDIRRDLAAMAEQSQRQSSWLQRLKKRWGHG